MASFCRWVGGFVLVIGTIALMVPDYAGAAACAALAFVWFIAGQFAEFTARQRRRDQPSHQHHPE
jgi:hypothetical protein